MRRTRYTAKVAMMAFLVGVAAPASNGCEASAWAGVAQALIPIIQNIMIAVAAEDNPDAQAQAITNAVAGLGGLGGAITNAAAAQQAAAAAGATQPGAAGAAGASGASGTPGTTLPAGGGTGSTTGGSLGASGDSGASTTDTVVGADGVIGDRPPPPPTEGATGAT